MYKSLIAEWVRVFLFALMASEVTGVHIALLVEAIFSEEAIRVGHQLSKVAAILVCFDQFFQVALEGGSETCSSTPFKRHNWLGSSASFSCRFQKRVWQEFFSYFCAVERGEPGEEFLLQHNLRLSAFKYGISDKLHLLRGELDDILLQGCDNYGNSVVYPFDVVSLDYCGGIVYKDSAGRSIRADSIKELVRNQAAHNQNFLLFITCNLDSDDRGEVRKVFLDIQNDLNKHGVDASQTVKAYLSHSKREAQLKVYVPYLIRSASVSAYRCETLKPVCYLGNQKTHMMSFSFWMERSSSFAAGRPNRQSLVQLLNLPVFECRDGDLKQTDFDIPKVEVS